MMYKISYIQNFLGKIEVFSQKARALKRYLELLFGNDDISNLQIFKDNLDITIKINKFLED